MEKQQFTEELPQKQNQPKNKSLLLISLLAVVGIGLLAAVIVLAVLLAEAQTPQPVPETDVCTSESCVYAAGQMLMMMDQSVDPCYDFYLYSCGGYERNENIPSGYNKFGLTEKATNLAQKNLRTVLEAPAPPKEGEAQMKARRFYKSCLDTEAVNRNGIVALKKIVNDLGGFVTSNDLPADWTTLKLMTKVLDYTIDAFFQPRTKTDAKNVKVNIITLNQGGLGLGSMTRDIYFLTPDIRENPIVVAYADMLTTYARLITGDANFDSELVWDVIRFEQDLASITPTNAELGGADTNYHRYDVVGLQRLAPFIDWLPYLQRLYQPFSDIKIDHTEPVVITSPFFFGNITSVIQKYENNEAGKRTLQNYAIFIALHYFAPNYGDQFQAANDQFMAVYAGRQGALPRWNLCVKQTDFSVAFGLGRLYIDAYFTAQGKKIAEDLLETVRVAFRQRIDAVDWMDKDTKAAALEKADALTYEAAYPEWLKDDDYLKRYYANFPVGDDYVQNGLVGYKFYYQQMLGKLRTGPDPLRWGMTPSTVSAYYAPTQNKFVVPAGILVSPYFYQSPDVSAALNYGGLGNVAGHEIGHGFDNAGSQFDKDGNLNNWWSYETRQKYLEKTQCIVDQYDAFEVDGLHIDGEYTQGENIADNGGLRASYQAYRNYVNSNKGDNLLPGVKLTLDQLFFVSYGQSWCALYTPESMRQQILGNVHAPEPFRVNGPVANSPDFARAFNCPSKSPMNPERKCTVW